MNRPVPQGDVTVSQLQKAFERLEDASIERRQEILEILRGTDTAPEERPINCSTSAYAVGDMESGLRHLKDLLSVMCTIQFELPAGEVDSRVDSLLFIADGVATAVYGYHETLCERRAKGSAQS